MISPLAFFNVKNLEERLVILAGVQIMAGDEL
jgi:hypothetical protein